MKRKSLKLVVSFILAMIASCDEPETVVTNIVHPDGSVTRKIEMRNIENKFEISNIQVPFDSTWTVRDSLEISDKGDTTWVKHAEKLFRNADEINRSYQADSGSNKDIARRAEFRKKFKWFNTEYRFAEIFDKRLSFGYPIEEFLNDEELRWFYSPEKITDEKENGADSLTFKAFNDTVDAKIDKWMVKSIVSEWISELVTLTEGKAGDDMTLAALKAREDEFVQIIDNHDENFDSLWTKGVLLKEFIGEGNARKYKTEADSALSFALENYLIDFDDYSVRIVMPGKLIGSNGFMDTTGIMLWPVEADYFLTQPYEMWAESKTPNIWAWIVSGVFVLFVIAGIIFKAIKK